VDRSQRAEDGRGRRGRDGSVRADAAGPRRSSEKIDPNALRKALEELREQEFAQQDKGEPDKAADAPAAPRPKPPKPHPGRARLPPHLPREERRHVLAEAERVCECCQKPKQKIREEVADRLDYVPSRFVIISDVTEVYGCSCGFSKKVAAEMPSRVIDGGLPEPGLLAHVVISARPPTRWNHRATNGPRAVGGVLDQLHRGDVAAAEEALAEPTHGRDDEHVGAVGDEVDAIAAPVVAVRSRGSSARGRGSCESPGRPASPPSSGRGRAGRRGCPTRPGAAVRVCDFTGWVDRVDWAGTGAGFGAADRVGFAGSASRAGFSGLRVTAACFVAPDFAGAGSNGVSGCFVTRERGSGFALAGSRAAGGIATCFASTGACGVSGSSGAADPSTSTCSSRAARAAMRARRSQAGDSPISAMVTSHSARVSPRW
jgi:hypothetical protein